MELISRKLCGFLLLALFQSVSFFFFLNRSPSPMLCTVFDPVSSSIDQVLSINTSANVFVFGGFNIHLKYWLTYSGGTISNNLTQKVNFPTQVHGCDVPWSNTFKLSASAAASDFCEWVQVGTDVYIPHLKYQVKKSHSSPWFSAVCAAAIVHRNHFFCFYQQNKSIESKVKFRLVIISKGFLKLPNLHMLLKHKSPSLPNNLALGTSWEFLITCTLCYTSSIQWSKGVVFCI